MNIEKIRVNSYMYLMTTIVVKSDKGINKINKSNQIYIDLGKGKK